MNFRTFLAVFILSLPLHSNAAAGDYEVTPVLGYTLGGQFESSNDLDTYDVAEDSSYGLILGLRDRSKAGAFYELLYSRQDTSFDEAGTNFADNAKFAVAINYLHLGGRYGKTGERVNPYVAAGVGVTHFIPEQGDAETRFSFSLGGGIIFPLNKHVGLRVEGRAFGSLFDSSGELFCVNNRCVVQVDGDLFWQFSGYSGITFSF